MSSFPSNIGLGLSPQVWLFSDFEGYNFMRREGYPNYLSPVQKARLERIRQARMLFDGQHRRLFLFEGRTQFDFPKTRSDDRIVQMFVPYNLCKLITLKSADLLFGDEPAVSVDDEAQDKALANLIRQTALHARVYAAALEASTDGEAVIEAVLQGGKVYLKRVDSADIFPQGLIQPDGQYESYVKYNAKNIGTEFAPNWKLLVTTYLPGRITRELKQLDSQGYVSPRRLTLNEWPQEDPQTGPLEPETITGIDTNTITWIPNLLIRDIAVSDYDGLIELQDALNSKQTQIARVLAKHSDPKLAAPASAADAHGNLPSGNDVFWFRSKDDIPQYLTWNAELAAAMADRDETRGALLIMAEMSPILLGIKDGASSKANAFKSIRLEAINSITKAGRKAVIWKAALRRMIETAQALELTDLSTVSYAQNPLGIEMRDGLPADTDSRAAEIQTLRAAGVMSIKRGVTLLIQDPAGVAAELADIAEENAAKTPSIFMGGPGEGAQGAGAANSNGIAAEAKDEIKDAAVEIAA